MQKSNSSQLCVLQIIPTLNAGGAERTTLDIAAAIVETKGCAIVVSAGGRLVGELLSIGAVHIQLPVNSKNPLTMLKNILDLRKIIISQQVNIVHARSRAPAWSAFCAAKLCGAAFITTYHGIYNSKNAVKRFYNSIMARGVVVIANSQFTANHIEAQHGAGAEIIVIPRGTDFEHLCPETLNPQDIIEMRTAWGVSSGKRIVLLPARLTRWKGQLVLIAAISLLKNQGNLPNDVHVVLAGDAQGRVDYVAELNAAVAGAGLQNFITIAPHISDMKAAYGASFMVIVPSTDPEAFGRVPVEAAGMGLPVIVSNHGAPCETVIIEPETARTGWRVKPNSPQDLAAAIAEVLNLSIEDYGQIGQRARQNAMKNYGLAQMKQKTLGVYARFLKK